MPVVRLFVIVALACGVACRPSEPLVVANVQVGRALNSDNSIATHTTRFAPDDTMYLSIITEKPGSGTFGVRWVYGGRVISEEQKDVSYFDRAATAFHIRYAGGFPPGDYTAEITLNGEPVTTRTLRVEK